MKQKSIFLAGALAVAGGVVIAAAGQASATDSGQPAPAPQATVASGSQLSDGGLVEPLGEWGVGRRTPRA
ncbi:hypothetical protein ABT143_36180 [Streptomyces sp. NPDC002033]|uniref:hypothetical protein n=1 Tax=unclassified Streptomyces TaxID=2593676 RepID=UPI0033325F63